jgi:hypothetical protein
MTDVSDRRHADEQRLDALERAAYFEAAGDWAGGSENSDPPDDAEVVEDGDRLAWDRDGEEDG